jgi:SagB-type dehydrogenase family enzyme
MDNRAIEHALKYHSRTKHSVESVRRGAHFLDWANQPLLFKIYPSLEPRVLPRETPQSGVAALSAIATPGVERKEAAPSLEQLAHLLYFSAGVTKTKRYRSGEEFLFRAASCTGALYEIELYAVCGPLPGLPAGVYHFNPGDMALRLLRDGDYRELVAAAAGNEASVLHAPVILISTGTYWRNAWKYRDRTFRHFGWDNGTLLANLLAVAAALGLPAKLLCAFVDAEVNRLLALVAKKEVCLTLAALGDTDASPPTVPGLAPLDLETVPLSRMEVDYPAMREMYRASSLSSADEVIEWRNQQAAGVASPEPLGEVTLLAPLDDEAMPRDTIEEVILRRGSTRRFRREPISFAQLSTILDRSTRGIQSDFAAPPSRLNDLYLIVHAVEGLRPGAYFYRQDRWLELLREGDFRKEAAHLGLDQDLPGDAAAAIFFLADLNHWLNRFGNRGYRAVQLEAGILGGKMYLAAYAQRLGATGLTFYDDEVVRFFSPHASGKSAIFLMAVGRGAKPRA